MAILTQKPPKAGFYQTQTDSTYVSREVTLSAWLGQLVLNVDDLHALGTSGFSGANVTNLMAAGETASIGPATSSNVSVFGTYAYLLTPVVFPTYGAVYNQIRLPDLVTDVNIFIQCSIRPGTLQTGVYPGVSVKVEEVFDTGNYVSGSYSLVEPDKFRPENFINFDISGESGLSPIGMHIHLTGLTPGSFYRFTPLWGIVSGAALPNTGTMVLTAQPAASEATGTDNQFTFIVQAGGL